MSKLRRWKWAQVMGCLLLGVVGGVTGCDNAPPPVDPARSPWLDPKTQIESLKDSDFRIRGLAAFHLGNMGARADEAMPALEKLAKEDANAKVRENAAEAVEKIRAAVRN